MPNGFLSPDQQIVIIPGGSSDRTNNIILQGKTWEDVGRIYLDIEAPMWRRMVNGEEDNRCLTSMVEGEIWFHPTHLVVGADAFRVQVKKGTTKDRVWFDVDCPTSWRVRVEPYDVGPPIVLGSRCDS